MKQIQKMKQGLMKDLLESVAHLFYPVLCPGCGSDTVQADQFLFLFCMDTLPYTGFTAIPGNPVEKIFRGRINIQSATSLLYFTKQSVVQSLLHQFKYEGNKEIGLYFGRRLGETMMKTTRFNDIDLLVPLPLHVQREKKRGFNQAMMLCQGISEVLKVPVADDLVVRRKATQTQTFRNRIERWVNIEQGFELNATAMISGKHVLLVDDVITTGATLEACGSELLKIENAKLSIATLAFTIL